MPLAERLEQAREQHRAGDVDGAEAAYQAILEEAPDWAPALYLRSVLHLQTRRNDSAEDLIRKALDADDGADAAASAVYQNTLGNVLHARGDFHSALAAFDAAVDLNPRSTDALYNAALMRQALGDAAKAERALRAALEVDEKHLGALNQLAYILRGRKQYRAAAELLRRALGLMPAGVDAAVMFTSNLGEVLLAGGEPLAAEEISHQLAGTAAAPMGEVLKAQALAARGLHEAARVSLLDLLAGDLGDASEVALRARYQLVSVLDRLDRPAEAYEAARHANALWRGRARAQATDPAAYLAYVEAHRAFIASDRGADGAVAPVGDGGAPPPVFLGGAPQAGVQTVTALLADRDDVVLTGDAAPLAAPLGWFAETGRPYPEGLAQLTAEDAATLRQRYLDAAAPLLDAYPGAVLVDEMPFNLVELPLIERLFPDATVLLCTRDPRESALAALFQRLPANDANAAYAEPATAAGMTAALDACFAAARARSRLTWHELRFDALADEAGRAALAAALGVAGVEARPGRLPPDDLPAGRWTAYQEIAAELFAALSAPESP